MSKQALKRVRKALGMKVCREPLDAYAWPGGYPIVYLFTDGGCLCPECANTNIEEIDAAGKGEYRCNSHGGWAVDAWEINWECDDMTCDHCHKPIESAYGEGCERPE